jgi:phosphatidate cytidylyltransferase
VDQVLKERSISAVIFFIVIMSFLYLGKYGDLALITIIICGIAYEMVSIATQDLTKTIIAVLITMVILLLGINYLPEKFELPLIIVTCIFHTRLINDMFTKRFSEIKALSRRGYLLYPMLSGIVFGRLIIHSEHPSMDILCLLVLIWLCDSFAYLVGRKLGKRKLYERVSPKKTWEGFGGSVVFTILGGIVLSQLLGYVSPRTMMIAAFIVVIFGTLGDLYQSQVKRIYDVKDSGRIMPGHGGIWDRFDSFVFILPFYTLILTLLK